MNIFFSALLALGVPVDAFAPQAPRASLQRNAKFSTPHTATTLMSDDEDWYADYDPSQYERSISGGDYDYDRGGGYGRGNAGRGYGGRRGGGEGARGGGGGRRRREKGRYERDTSRDASNVDEAAVTDLIRRRSEARRDGDYDAADAIREELLNDHSVGLDDREGTWRTGVSASGSGLRYGGGGRRGGRGGRRRDFGPNGHDYDLSADAGPNTSKFAEQEIHALLAERLKAKMDRNFVEADAIQMDLIEGGVFVHDGTKEWRADGVPYGSFEGGGRGGPGRTAGTRNDRQAYTKSPHSADIDGGGAAADSLIDGLVKERTRYKMTRDYEKADAIREGLRTKFNVLIDDRLKQWSKGGDFGPEINARRELADKFANRGYVKSASSVPLSPEDEESVQRQVDERARAKKDRDFRTADGIRADLAETFDVDINDKLKLWSAGGAFEELGGKQLKPRGVYARRGGGHLSDEDAATITEMLSERYEAKRERNFDLADDIRDRLMRTFNVRIDDRSNEWHIDTHEYAMCGENNLSAEELQYIDSKLKERFTCKRERNYDDADAIREELMEKFGVSVDDRTKEWAVVAIPEYGVDEETQLEDASDDLDEYREEDKELELHEALEAALDDSSAAVEFEGRDDDSVVAFEEEEDAGGREDEGDGDAMITEEEELTKLTVAVLKEKLKSAGLPVSGRKAELIARLLE